LLFIGGYDMTIHESGEMYLESILVLSRSIANVRAIDIVNHTGYSKPSISRALGLLKKDCMVTVDDNGYIRLTAAGEAHALKIYERHRILSAYFEHLGVSHEVASSDACKIEHVISDETFDKIKAQVLKISQ
jgi:Mn-dependent DtxR family transcriptional regulator